MLEILKWVVAFVYFFCSTLYIANFIKRRDALEKSIPFLLLFAIIIHSFYLGFLRIRLGHLPLSTVFEVLTTCVWFFALIYIVLEFKIKDKSLGTIIVPIIFIFQTISNIFIDVSKPLAPVLTNLTFEIHVIFMLLAYSGFVLSFISSLMYIFLSGEIHDKHLGFFYLRLPSLELLDRLSNMAATIGLTCITVGMVIGYYMGTKVWDSVWQWDPKLLSVILTWIIYSFHLYTRSVRGWQGKRAAILSILGFNWVLFSFLIVTLFLSKIHSFY